MVDVGMTRKLVENPKGSRRATGTGLGPNYAQASSLYVTANAGDEMACDCFTPSPVSTEPMSQQSFTGSPPKIPAPPPHIMLSYT